MYEPSEVGSVKVGKYIIDPESKEVCRVVSVDHSKPGKHGSAKARMVMIGLFDGKKREFVSGVDKRVNIPIITKHEATLTNVLPDSLMLMDKEDFQEIETPFPTDEELKDKIMSLFEKGKNIAVEYWRVMNRLRIDRVMEE